MELMDKRLRYFCAKIDVGQIGAQSPLLWEFKACRAPELFGVKHPIDSCCWIDDMGNAQQTSFCPEGANVGFISYILRGKAQD